MNFKKKLLIPSIVATLSISGFAQADDVFTDTAIIYFTGAFQDTTCQVEVNNNIVSGGASTTIDLGIHKLSEITGDGDATSPVAMEVKFSNCGSIANASVAFSGTQSTADKSLFDVTSDNKGIVGVGINAAAAVGSYFKDGAANSIAISSGTGSSTFYARYVKIGSGAVVAAQSNSQVTMNITYS